MDRSCGTCSLCCKIIDVPSLNKPAHVWCEHARPGKGCGIWGSHPHVCQVWKCGWQLSEDLDERWKPNKCGFILYHQYDGRQVVVEVDPQRPDAWRKPPFYDAIRRWAAGVRTEDKQVIVRTGRRVLALFPEEDLDIGILPQGQAALLGYRYDPKYRQPMVRIFEDGRLLSEKFGAFVLA